MEVMLYAITIHLVITNGWQGQTLTLPFSSIWCQQFQLCYLEMFWTFPVQSTPLRSFPADNKSKRSEPVFVNVSKSSERPTFLESFWAAQLKWINVKRPTTFCKVWKTTFSTIFSFLFFKHFFNYTSKKETCKVGTNIKSKDLNWFHFIQSW